MAELESRLAAHTAETEKLKVCRISLLQYVCMAEAFITSAVVCSSLVQEETKRLSERRADLEQQLASATSTVAILQTEKAKLQTEVQESKKEQDDLLMLLADQDQKIHSLKQKLKNLGETVDRLYLHH